MMYEARLKWMQKNFPVDDICMTPDDMSCAGPMDYRTPEHLQTMIAQFHSALDAIRTLATPMTTSIWYDFRDAKGNWVYDNLLPKDIPISYGGTLCSYSRYPMDQGSSCSDVHGRTKWVDALQDDWSSFHAPHLWVGRTRCMAVDARSQGCTGGLATVFKPREEELGINAMARAGWDQSTFTRTVMDGPGYGDYWHDDAAVSGTDHPEIYRSGIAGFWYRISVPNGSYTLTCHFRKFTKDAKAGDRVFDVKYSPQANPINRSYTTIIHGLDILKQAGGINHALVVRVPSLQVTDGCVDIQCSGVSGSRLPPIMCAIEVGNDSYSKKINFGSGAHGDFHADVHRYWTDNACSMTQSTADFYDDWARQNFGTGVGACISQIFQGIDSHLPAMLEIGDMQGWEPDPIPWSETEQSLQFLDQLEALRSQVKGPGNLDRFDWWLNNFRFLRASMKVEAQWYACNQVIAQAKAETDVAKKRQITEQEALPIYRELVKSAHAAITAKLLTVQARGSISTVNGILWCMKVGTNGGPISAPLRAISELLGSQAPAGVALPTDYLGAPRLIVPVIRDRMFPGELFSVRIWYLDSAPPTSAEVFWRPMGMGEYRRQPLRFMNGNEYRLDFDEAMRQAGTVEYYLRMTMVGGEILSWPASAPGITQTVITLPHLDCAALVH